MATKTLDLKHGLVLLTLAFVVASTWADPHQAGVAIGHFLGSAGHFGLTLLDKLTRFLSGLTGGSSTSPG